MKLFLILLIGALCALFIAPLLVAAVRKAGPWLNTRLRRRHLRRVALANDNLALECRRKTTRLKADAAIARYLLVKVGTDNEHGDICAAANRPLGNSDDSPGAAEDPFTVHLFGLGEVERIAIASEAIANDVDIYTAAGGKVQDEPAAAGTFWHVGRTTQAAAGDGDKVRFIPCFPTKLVVVDTTVGSDAGTTQTLANALNAALNTATRVKTI